MKCLVTGGAGFIGSHITDFLVQKGYDVVILDNLSTGKKENINEKAKFIKADITSDLSDIFSQEQPDVVIHTAAQVMLRDSIEHPVHDATTNIIGTINVLEACKKNNVKKIVYTSTGGARVGEPDYLPVDEDHPIRPTAPYGISKHTAEHYVWMYGEIYNIDYLIFCFGNVYGPRDDPACKRVTSLFAHMMMNNKTPTIFGDGKQTRDFLYVIDLADLIVNSINKKPKHKLFHLANGTQISVNDVVAILKKELNYAGEIKHVEGIKGEVRDIVLDTSLVQKELGWKPKHTYEQGVKETIVWMKEYFRKN